MLFIFICAINTVWLPGHSFRDVIIDPRLSQPVLGASVEVSAFWQWWCFRPVRCRASHRGRETGKAFKPRAWIAVGEWRRGGEERLGLGLSVPAALAAHTCIPPRPPAAAHASHKWMLDEKKFKARWPERHDGWAAPSDSQRSPFTDRK